MFASKMSSALAAIMGFAAVSQAAVTPMLIDERDLSRRAVQTGLGTMYGSGECEEADCWQNGACAFVDYELPTGIDGTTCVSEEIWDNGANCGGCISVTYKGKTLTIMVTNKTDGKGTHLDMTPNTFHKLYNGAGGGIDGIEWEFVKCPITQPLWIKMHGGASQYWVAATVENANRRTSKLEVSADKGATWKTTTRDINNFFKMGGTLNTNTAWFRVTSQTGSTVVVKDVKLASGVVTKATENYA